MTAHYDYVVIGAGLFGAVFAREMTDRGKKVLVLERRAYIGGNCADYQVEHYHVCRHGGHIFHTNDARIWAYVNRFTPFRQYHHKVMAAIGYQMYSFPINLMTMHQLWGVRTPLTARMELAERKKAVADPNANMEDWCLANIGEELYRLFVYGYTVKQWGREPVELPASIIKRIPVRLTYDDGYFSDTYQGMPEHGYTALFEALLEGAEVQTGVDYFDERQFIDSLGEQVVFTGPIDQFHNYRYGPLEYRSLKFSFTEYQGDFLGVATVNYPDERIPWTRAVEFQHFYGGGAKKSVVMHEYPAPYQPGGEAFYPIKDEVNTQRYEQYRAIPTNAIFGGRLGTYQYLDMHQCVAQALSKVKQLCA